MRIGLYLAKSIEVVSRTVEVPPEAPRGTYAPLKGMERVVEAMDNEVVVEVVTG